MVRTVLCCLLPGFILATSVWAQEPTRVPFACRDTDLQNAGLLCTEDEPCSIYLEINAVAAAGKKIFLAGDIHATATTLSSVLLSSDDNGLTWKEPAPRVAAASIDQLQIYDLDHGWVAGEIQYPLPRDPFFLVTSDGGLSWRRRDVTEDGGPGSILRFWFDSPQHGELIVDGGKSAPSGRYLDYESETGGESWMLRSTTGAAPKIRRAPLSDENPDFRVHAAAGGKTYEVEKREGDRWQPAGSLLIEIASCKVKAPEAKEPTPELETPPAKDYVEELKLGAPDAKKPVPPKKGPPNQ
jgi:hypothetical protein